jgi:hypothetical protein
VIARLKGIPSYKYAEEQIGHNFPASCRPTNRIKLTQQIPGLCTAYPLPAYGPRKMQWAVLASNGGNKPGRGGTSCAQC